MGPTLVKMVVLNRKAVHICHMGNIRASLEPELWVHPMLVVLQTKLLKLWRRFNQSIAAFPTMVTPCDGASLQVSGPRMQPREPGDGGWFVQLDQVHTGFLKIASLAAGGSFF